MLGVYSLICWIIRHFGAAAERASASAGVMQAVFLPAMAIAFAVPAIAGQNFSAKARSRAETFRRGELPS